MAEDGKVTLFVCDGSPRHWKLQLRVSDRVGVLFQICEVLMQERIEIMSGKTQPSTTLTSGARLGCITFELLARTGGEAAARTLCELLERRVERCEGERVQRPSDKWMERFGVNPDLLSVASFREVASTSVRPSTKRKFQLELCGINQPGLLAYMSLVLNCSGFNIVDFEIEAPSKNAFVAKPSVTDRENFDPQAPGRKVARGTFILSTRQDQAPLLLRQYLDLPDQGQGDHSAAQFPRKPMHVSSKTSSSTSASSIEPLSPQHSATPPTTATSPLEVKSQRRVVNFPNGDEYCGESKHFPDGEKLHGEGEYTYSRYTHATFRQYIGQWSEGFKHGRGVMLYQDGGAYVGQWQRNERHGEGVQFEYESDQAPQATMPTVSYEGEWKRNKMDGFGVEENPDSSYFGHFRDGIPSEVGGVIITWTQGRTARSCEALRNGVREPLLSALVAEASRLVEDADTEEASSPIGEEAGTSVTNIGGPGTLLIPSSSCSCASFDGSLSALQKGGSPLLTFSNAGNAALIDALDLDAAVPSALGACNGTAGGETSTGADLQVANGAQGAALTWMQSPRRPQTGISSHYASPAQRSPSRRRASSWSNAEKRQQCSGVETANAPAGVSLDEEVEFQLLGLDQATPKGRRRSSSFSSGIRSSPCEGTSKTAATTSGGSLAEEIEFELLTLEPNGRSEHSSLSPQTLDVRRSETKRSNSFASPRSWASPNSQPLCSPKVATWAAGCSEALGSTAPQLARGPMLWSEEEAAAFVSCLGLGRSVAKRVRRLRLRGAHQLLQMEDNELEEILQTGSPIAAVIVRRALKVFLELDRRQHNALRRALPGAAGDDVILREFVVPFQEVELGEKISEGGYGTVYRGLWRPCAVSGKKGELAVAVKEMKGDRDVRLHELLKEGRIMASMRHRNICQFVGISADRGKQYVLSELMDGSLFDLIHQPLHGKEHLTVISTVELFAQIVAGVGYLHVNNLVHADLKSSNVLVTNILGSGKLLPKICDFGHVACRAHPAPHRQCGTPHWAAPEALRNEAVAPAADIFSSGVMLWEALTSHIPHRELTFAQVLVAVGWAGWTPSESLLPVIPGELRVLLRECMSLRPSQRPAAAKVRARLRQMAAKSRADALASLASFMDSWIGCRSA